MLGPLEVRDGPRTVDLGGLKQRAVLAVLLINANRVVSLDRMIDELWGDEPPSRATGSLQAYISNLRRALEPDRPPRAPATVLVSQAPGYALRIRPEQLDAFRFEELAGQGRRLLDEGRPDEARQVFEQARQLWRGPPLAEFAFEPFASAEIARLVELRATVDEGRIDAELALGHHGAAAAALEAVVAEHPLRERPRAQLMLALYRAGRQADALRVYAETRAVLADELGLDPGPALQQLEREILQQSPSLEWRPPDQIPVPAPAAVKAPPEAGSPPADTPGSVADPLEPVGSAAEGLVGRTKVLARLREVLAAAVGGSGRLLLLSGEPGIGKTRLAEVVAGEAAGRGAAVAWGRSYEGEGAPAFWPWVQVLRVLLGPLEPAERTALAGSAAGSLVPELARGLAQDGEGPSPPADPAAARFELYEGVTSLMTSLAARRPVVIVLDDVQWADVSSLRLLQFLATAVRTAAVLVVVAYRDLELTPGHPLTDVLAALAREPATERIELGRLGPDDVSEYVDASTGGAAGREFARGVFERTEGNPFFMTELVRLAVSEGTVDPSRRGLTAVPAGVRDVIRRRVARLPEDAQSLLTVASVIGRDFPLDLLEAASGFEDDRVIDLLETALVTGIVTDSPDGVGRYRFSHGLVRETLYDAVSAVRRTRVHARVTDAIERLHGDHLAEHAAELAYHSFEAAGASPVAAAKAVAYASLAAEQAGARLADDEAVQLWEQALAVLRRDRQTSDDAARFTVLLGLAGARRRAGDVAGARETRKEALQLAVDAGDPERIAQAAAGFGNETLRTWRDYGVADESVASLLERALAVVGAGDSRPRLRVLSSLAVELSYGRHAERGDELSGQAVELARRLGDPEAMAVALSARVVVVMGRPEGALDQLAASEELLALPGESVPAETRVVGRLNHAAALLWLGRVEESLDDRAVCEREAEELKLPSLRAHVAWSRAMWAILDGRLADAEEESTRAYALHQRTSMWGGGERRFGQLFTIRREQDRHAEIEPPTAEIAESSQFPVFTYALGLLRAEMGRLDEARAAVAHVLPVARNWSWLFTMCIAAELWAALRDVDRSAESYAALRPFAGRMGAGGGGGSICWGSVDHFIAQAAATAGRTGEAAIHFEAALVANQRAGGGPFLGRSQLAYAELLLRRRDPGDVARATILIEEAAELAAAKDLAYVARRATAARRELELSG